MLENDEDKLIQGLRTDLEKILEEFDLEQERCRGKCDDQRLFEIADDGIDQWRGDEHAIGVEHREFLGQASGD